MDELLEVKGSTLTVYVPEELDHHYAEQIRVESEPGVGTSFFVSFCREEVPEDGE